MSRRIGSTPFRDLLAHSIATDPTLRAAADALDQAMDRAMWTLCPCFRL